MTTPDTIWLTGGVSPGLLPHAGRNDLGLLITPDTFQYVKYIDAFGVFAFDNACFGSKVFDPERWIGMLAQVPTKNCLFATAPDVVGKHAETVARSAEWLPRIRALGHKAGFVAQNGATVDNVPWDDFDVLFIGGVKECEPCGFTAEATDRIRMDFCPWCAKKLTEWKMSVASVALMDEANRQGKSVHVGRVNSGIRYNWSGDHGAASSDGTFLTRGPDQNIPRMLRWLDGRLSAQALAA
jgi:hypothetical protein